MTILTKKTKALKPGVYEITFDFTTETSNICKTIYLDVDKPQRIISIESFLFDHAVETFKEGYPEIFIKKEGVRKKPEITNVKYKSEYFNASK